MTSMNTWIHKKPLIVGLLLFPLISLLLLYLAPSWNIPIWGLTWYTRLVYYYFTSFAGFMALVLALFANSALGSDSQPRTLFITLAFAAIAALLLLEGISTPDVLIPGAINELFRWSLRLGLPLGAIFFAISEVSWSPAIQEKLMRYRTWLWLFCALLYLLFITLAIGYAPLLASISNTPFDSLIKFVLGLPTIFLFLWAAYRSWQTAAQNPLIKSRLAIAMVILAEAQLCLMLGDWGKLSWLLHNPLTLVGLTVALSAILHTFETVREGQAARYFAALGSIVILGLSLVSGELGARWLESINRSSVVSLALIQGGLSFLVLYFIVLHLDRLITERTEALHQEQRLRADLTQLIVHDLKNPLTVITSGISLLMKQRTGSLNEMQTRLLSSLQGAGQDTLKLINDLLDVERLEAGTLPLKNGSVDVGRVLQGQVAKAQIPATTYKQDLTLILPDKMPAISGDRELLERLFSNILSNAMKFTPEGGKIRVSMAYQGRYLQVSIEDDGPGVPPVFRQRIFEKFGQVQGTERRGVGLGLAFCKMVVEAHNGRISVADSQLGGALFEVVLPVKGDTQPIGTPALGQL